MLQPNRMTCGNPWKIVLIDKYIRGGGIIKLLLSLKTAGAATVTAYINEIPYSFEVVATTPDITATSVRKIIGNTQQISILGTKGKVEWKSDNTAIATVSDTGLITAEGTGAGQGTVVHAYVDGMEFKIDVEVEPIPQLSSTYKIYGHQDGRTQDNGIAYENASIAICTNANETVTYPINIQRAVNTSLGGQEHHFFIKGQGIMTTVCLWIGS